MVTSPNKPTYLIKNRYFSKETDQAIIDYNNTNRQIEKNKIFNNHIYYSFYKLAENQINSLKAYYIHSDIEESKHEVVTFLLEKIHMYDVTKGSAFSWFNIIARNYIIARNKEAYKEIIKYNDNVDLSDDTNAYNNTFNYNEQFQTYDQIEQNLEDNKHVFFELFINQFPANINKYFPKNIDNKIAIATSDILLRWKSVDIFNKKAIYVYIKEMTNAKTQQITRVLAKIYKLYLKLYFNWIHTGNNILSF